MTGHGPVMAAADALTEAFLWSAQRTVTKTTTVSLHGNTYQVPAVLVGQRVELVLSPFDLEHITVRHRDQDYGAAVPFVITRHAHPKARPETIDPAPVPGTGIAYLQLVADAHHQQLASEERIGFHALYSSEPTASAQGMHHDIDSDELPGQLSINDALDPSDHRAHSDSPSDNDDCDATAVAQ